MRLSKEMKQSRICARCGHVNDACDCEHPVWVSMQVGFGKSVYELRKLPCARVRDTKW